VDGPEIVERLVAAINAGDIVAMGELFLDDAVMEWPQSGERVVGADNRRAVYTAFPALPRITPIRLVGEGDLWVAECTTDYGEGGVFQTVLIFELRGGKIAKETAYWAQPFPAPAWRAGWVERIDGAQEGASAT
jgi:ketosteroid isomerase-like protein